ncbi:MAG: flagellar motor protein MotB [Sphingomonas sp.]
MTIDDEFPEAAPGRPVWLMTLADLGLLLVGFFVFIQASQHLDGKTLARGIREGFGAVPSGTTAAAPETMPVAAAAMLGFAPGSAVLPSSPDGLIAWSRAVMSDPRVTLKVSGGVDGTSGDVDRLTGSGALLAADRGRAVAAALASAQAVPPGRMTITGTTSGRRSVVLTLAFDGAAPHRFAPAPTAH